MTETLPIWRIFNYLARTWYDLPAAQMDEFYTWYNPAISFVWSRANQQEIDRRKERENAAGRELLTANQLGRCHSSTDAGGTSSPIGR